MEDSTTINMDEITLLIVGKTGNGKSSVGNRILGKPKFQVSTGMASGTTRMSQAVGVVNGRQIKVIDTPEPVNLDLSDTEICDEVARWKSLAVGKFAILVAVRCDVRYTAEEYDIYKKIKRAWGDNNSFTSHLMVVFTFGDLQDRDIHEELKTVCWELRSVLADAGGRYVLFNNKAFDSGREVRKLLGILERMAQPPSNPPCNQQQLQLLLLQLLLVFVATIFSTALWFGVPWVPNIVKTPVFFVIFVVIVVGTFAYVYRKRFLTYLNCAMLM